MMRHRAGVLLSSFALLISGGFAQGPRGEYAVVLEAPPLADAIQSRKDLGSAAAVDRRAAIEASQRSIAAEARARNLAVTGTVQTLANAVFVYGSREQARALGALPGVARVQYMPPVKRHLDRALDLVKAPAAWPASGGEGNAGAGVKIAVLDTGIDQTHPGLQDSSLSPPAGFPKGDTAYTNSKVIVARSYVPQLAYIGFRPEATRPDDYTPLDRTGHGTAVAMAAAGVRNAGPRATIAGVAPKAFLGNYKIFGSPGVNDTTLGSVVTAALEEAFRDGMDIATLSIGSPALYGPLETGCSGGDCDIRAQAVERAVRGGMTVIVSAGNDGNIGLQFPTLNTIHTPGTAPSAITVGASTNAHLWYATLSVVPGPSSLAQVNGLFGDGPRPASPLTAPLRDVASVQDDGYACAPLGNGTLTGTIALVQRGNCAFSAKANHAQRAGAVAVVVYNNTSDVIFNPANLAGTSIPMLFIGRTAGVALKSHVQSNAGVQATLDPALRAVATTADEVADFSSRGPSIDLGVKPELVAPGTGIYTATQRLDPNGDLYDVSRYTAAGGTSFAAPLAAGAAALVKQRYPQFRPAQIKSALVNTATQDVNDGGSPARIAAVGAGKLNAQAAVAVTATAEPATLSFGAVTGGTLPISRTLAITNVGSSAATYNITVNQRDRDNNASLAVTPSSLNVNSGAQGTVSVRLSGNLPVPGRYEGFIVIQGGGATLRVPYLYAVGDGVAYDAFPIAGMDFEGEVNQTDWLMAMKVVDRYGVPVANAPVRFRVLAGGGRIDTADSTTDRLGIAGANVVLGPQLGEQEFTGETGSLTVEFFGTARQKPAISRVVNAASFEAGRAVAPGSYVTIFGAALSDVFLVFATPYLPLSLAHVSVSFDSGGLSLPGRIHFVSDQQVNVQAPWEFQGRSSVQMKVSLGLDVTSAPITVQLSDYSPAAFEYDDSASGRRLAAALDQNFQLITGANPARRGQVVQIYANGLGPVDNQPPTGEPSPAEPLARTRVTPVVTIGGRQAPVSFSGLAPYFVGLYQLNVTVPADAPTGIQPVIVSSNGIESKPASLPVQ